MVHLTKRTDSPNNQDHKRIQTRKGPVFTSLQKRL